jgi:alcohol dehydrogenase
VVRFNGKDPAVAEEYRLLFPEGAEALATRLEEFLRIAGLPSSLSELGVKESDDDSLAEEAEQQWTGTFNPVPVKREDFVALYKAAF